MAVTEVEVIELQRKLIRSYEEKIKLLDEQLIEKNAALGKAEEVARRALKFWNPYSRMGAEGKMLLVKLRSDEGHCDAFYLPDDAVFRDAKKRFCDNFHLDADTTHLCVYGTQADPNEPLEVADGQEIFVKTESGQLKTREWPVTVSGDLFSFDFTLPAGRPPSKQELYKLAVEAASPGFDFSYVNDEGVHPLRPEDTTELDKLTLAEPVIEILAFPKEEDSGNRKRLNPVEDDHSWKRNHLSSPEMSCA